MPLILSQASHISMYPPQKHPQQKNPILREIQLIIVNDRSLSLDAPTLLTLLTTPPLTLNLPPITATSPQRTVTVAATYLRVFRK